MTGVVRNIWATRLAALAVLLAVLIQAALASPAALRMAADPAPVCGPLQPGPGGDSPSHTTPGHAHCLLCQANGAPPLAPATLPLPLPAAIAWVLPQPDETAQFSPQPTAIGFSSRAPPALA